MGGGLGQTLMTGMAFGAGSAVAHKAVDSVLGGGSRSHGNDGGNGGEQQPQQQQQMQQAPQQYAQEGQ